MTTVEERDIRIALGFEAEEFLRSRLGIYIQERAEMEIDAIKDELVEVDPDNQRKIKELQNRIKRYQNFDGWLKEVIESGNASYEEYQMESEDY
jgi:TPP-dependent trihydroxycyclohexane-1,2-dione (THcHDO) dehydratase